MFANDSKGLKRHKKKHKKYPQLLYLINPYKAQSTKHKTKDNWDKNKWKYRLRMESSEDGGKQEDKV